MIRPSGLKFKKSFGFTVLELIIAISIIGILTVIVSVSYTGVSERAIESAIKSDLSNALGEINLFKTEKNKYPTAINNCPNVDSNSICLKLSGDNEYQYTVDNNSSPKTFLLVASNGDLAYFVDNTSNKPTKLLEDSLITSIGAINGTTRDGETLTAGAITPSSATVTYQWKRADTSGGTYANISGATSSTYLLSSQDVGKYIKVTATGTGSYTGVVTSASVGAIQNNTPPPSTPTVTVVLSSPNVLATASIVTCTTGTAQYGLRSRTNDGTWSSYSAWSTTRTSSQTANDGVKYGYQAQARCYIDASNYSATVTSIESTYIDPISTPSAVTVSNSSTSTTTTWSWTSSACPSGTSARYQYRYTNSQGYDSGLVATASTSVSFTTSTESVTYTVAVQQQCYNSNTTSSWSTAANSSYYRAPSLTTVVLTGPGPWTAPAGVSSITVYAWGAGGSGGYGCLNQGGGGGGAFATKAITVVPGNSYSYFVGTANWGTAGEDTWFINSSTVLAKGGGLASTSNGGIGGSAAACMPTAGAYSGGAGGVADSVNEIGGGGGGGAGSSGNGAAGSGTSPGGGGGGTYSGGPGGSSVILSNTNGTSPGGGGAGDDNYDCSNGTLGGNGKIILTY